MQYTAIFHGCKKDNFQMKNCNGVVIFAQNIFFFLFFFFFLIQFNVPFKIISLIETSQSIGGRNGSTPGKPPDTPASRTCLVSHVASAGLEPTPDTAVRAQNIDCGYTLELPQRGGSNKYPQSMF